MKIMKMNDCGFTLVELIIVIIMIGILISIATVSYLNLRSRANTDVCLSNQKTLDKARVYNYIYTGEYGVDIEDISNSLNEMGLKAQDLVCPTGGTYDFIVGTHVVSCSITEHRF